MKRMIGSLLVLAFLLSMMTVPSVVSAQGQDIVIGDFENGTDDWQWGSNVTGIANVTSSANQPGTAYEGGKFSEISTGSVPGTTWRTIYKNFAAPLDVSGSPVFEGAFNTYGIDASHTEFEAKLTFYNGTESYESTQTIVGNAWNELSVDLSRWSFNQGITKIEISFRSVTYSTPWTGKHHVDGLGFRSLSAVSEWNFESGTDGWQSGSNVVGLDSVTTSLNQPGTAYVGSKFAEISTDGVSGTTWRTIYKDFATPLDVSGSPVFEGAFNTYGINASNTEFEVKLTFHNGTESYESIQTIEGDTWNELSVDLSEWSFNQAISKIEISFRSVTFSTPWTGKHHVDGLKFGNAVIDGNISTITANASSINIVGDVVSTDPMDLSVIELATYEDYSLAGSYTPLATTTFSPVNQTIEFSFSVNRYNGNADRAYSKFAVIDSSTKELVDIKYVTDITDSVNNYAFPVANTIKGLQVQMVDDAQKVGIGHAALNVAFNSMFVPATSSSEKIPFTVDGETFYFRKEFVDRLDLDTKTLSDDDVIVSYILIMYDRAHCGGGDNAVWWDESASINNLLLHPDYSGTGTVAAFNTTDANGLKYYKAALEFLGSRYTRADEAYGRAVNFIVGNEVNSQYYWYDMGDKTVSQFVDQYSEAFRIAHTALKKYYENARVYISLDHFWNGNIGAGATKTYNGKAIVDAFNEETKSEGNIDWHVAYHPYPEDLFDPKVWEDTTATDSFDSLRINFKNLDVLSDYMNQPDYLYDGAMRRIILSEQGFHSLDNSLANQKLQAAAYAYSYYVAKFTPGIDSFILHRHVDHGLEGGLNLGFWTYDTSKPIEWAPNEKKYLYDVFSKIDTSESLNVTEFAKSIIGITDWSDIIEGFDVNQLADRELPTSAIISSASIAPDTYVSDFETDNDGWVMSEYTQALTRVTSSLNAPGTAYNGSYMLDIDMTNDNDNNAYGYGAASAEHGITKVFGTPIDVSSKSELQFAVNSWGGCPNAAAYTVTVRMYSGDKILQAATTMTPNSWNTLSVDISGWSYRDSVDKIKLWFSTDSTYNWGGHAQFDSIGFK